jgi:flagellar hook-associated protein 2
MGLRIGPVTFGGLSSGIDTNEIISQLVELQRRPVTLLEDRKTDFEEKLSILQDLATRVRTLQTRLRALDNMNSLGTDLSANEEFRKYTATSSDTDILKATATSSARPSTLTIDVTALAQNSRHVSQGYDEKTDEVGTGTLRITVGTTQTDVTIDESNNTVEGVVGAINDSGADVRAFLLNDGSSSPHRIVVEGTKTGADYDVSLERIGWNGPVPMRPDFTETQDAQNASLTLDPGGDEVAIENDTNTFANVIGGLTLEAISVPSVSTPVAVQVTEDEDAVVSAVQDLVAAYNEVVDLIQEQSEVDPETNRGGPLIGDVTLVSLQRQLASIVVSVIGEGDVVSAAQIGLSTDTEGNLSVDEDKLREKLSAGLEDVAAFLAGSGSFADQLRTVTDTYLKPVTGLLVTRIDGTSASISDVADQIQKAEDRLETFEENLVRQFTALERAISGFQQQSTFISQYLLTLSA